jgi:site-specific DNA recombinase
MAGRPFNERRRAGMKMRVEQGRWPFKAPIGYLKGTDGQGSKTLLLDPKRAELVKEAFEQFVTGLYTKEQVRARVNALGLRTINGKPLSAETFDRMLYEIRFTLKSFASRAGYFGERGITHH